jgi:hypothetical protein
MLLPTATHTELLRPLAGWQGDAGWVGVGQQEGGGAGQLRGSSAPGLLPPAPALPHHSPLPAAAGVVPSGVGMQLGGPARTATLAALEDLESLIAESHFITASRAQGSTTDFEQLGHFLPHAP